VVKSALQHHNTLWWTEDWTLDSLAFYESRTGELLDSLQTLHLTADLPNKTDTDTAQASQPLSEAASATEVRRAMNRRGIRNLTLWCVGVAFLQIGLWRPIRWDDDEEVRERLPSLERLSKSYFDMTDKLINCDFGKGAKLQNLDLQNEVYKTVVCELDAILDEFRKAGFQN